MSTYGGQALFGGAVSVKMDPIPDDFVDFSFFGVSGRLRLWGGGRGRRFTVRGVLAGDSPASVAAARDLILSFQDGVGRVLYDSVEDRSWAGVVFTGAFTWTGPYGLNSLGWWRPYEAVFEGLI